jgi:hypothetical protein
MIEMDLITMSPARYCIRVRASRSCLTTPSVIFLKTEN